MLALVPYYFFYNNNNKNNNNKQHNIKYDEDNNVEEDIHLICHDNKKIHSYRAEKLSGSQLYGIE